MRIIQPDVQLLASPVQTQEAVLRHIEQCGRVCYKSEDKIADDTADKFVKGIIKRGHEAVLEHSRLIIVADDAFTRDTVRKTMRHMSEHGINPFITVSGNIMSGNVRAWRALILYADDNDVPDAQRLAKQFWMKYPALFPDSDYAALNWLPIKEISQEKLPVWQRWIHGWHTLRFVCDRGVSHELVRHRPASFCQESTRYCNYSQNRFNAEITVIDPYFFAPDTLAYDTWWRACHEAEKAYFALLEEGATAQEARGVLPTDLKTEVYMTATNAEWLHFLRLRTAEAAHPKMRVLARKAGALLERIDPEVFDRREWSE